MTTNLESENSVSPPEGGEESPNWFRIGLVAVASALAGGVAAAWWYRKTLNKLHESGEKGKNPQFGIFADAQAEDSFDDA